MIISYYFILSVLLIVSDPRTIYTFNLKNKPYKDTTTATNPISTAEILTADLGSTI